MELARSGDVLTVRGLTKAFGDLVVLDDVELALRPGDLVVVSGDNGIGKSTLMECLAGAQAMDSGQLALSGSPTTAQHAAYWQAVYSILDDFAWFPDLTVFDHYRLLDPYLTREAAVAQLARLRAEHCLDRLPMTLSSGQRQRCALVSSSIRDWSVLVLDEPERHLDRVVLPLVGAFLRELAERRAVLLASHEPQLLEIEGARTLRLADGRLVPSA